jgi:hypothetical protein
MLEFSWSKESSTGEKWLEIGLESMFMIESFWDFAFWSWDVV